MFNACNVYFHTPVVGEHWRGNTELCDSSEERAGQGRFWRGSRPFESQKFWGGTFESQEFWGGTFESQDYHLRPPNPLLKEHCAWRQAKLGDRLLKKPLPEVTTLLCNNISS